MAGDSDKQWTERTTRKCFRCGSAYNLITKGPKPPRDNKKQQMKVHFNKRGNYASQK